MLYYTSHSLYYTKLVLQNLSNISSNITPGAIQNWSNNAYQLGLTGQLDDFKLYNKVLTSDEVRKEYQIDTSTIAPIITQEIINTQASLEAYNRDRYKELEYITPISELEYIYKKDTGALNLPPIISMTEANPSSVSTSVTPSTPSTSLGTSNTSNSSNLSTSTQEAPVISPTTLSLLNPKNYVYSILSPSSIEIQISGVFYTITLSNYIDFYTNLEASNINTLAKYLSNLEKEVEEISYTKYYINKHYEVDSRGYTTINIPFNNKIVATYKYSISTSTSNLSELSYIHNNYLGSPILLTNNLASTTELILTNPWGSRTLNNYNTNLTLSATIGYTGHKYNTNTNLVYAHARYLNNTNKQWLSTDPYSITNFNSDIKVNY